jgi:hypothetical protein
MARQSTYHYHFGDVTRMVMRWLGPHVGAVSGRIDWLKFGKALVLAFIAGQTVDWAVVGGAIVGAIDDTRTAAALPAATAAVVYAIEQVRRVFQDGEDIKNERGT